MNRLHGIGQESENTRYFRELEQNKGAETPANKPADASTNKPADASANKPADASANKPADASANKPADASANKPADASANKPTDTSVKPEGEAAAKKAKGKGLRLGTRLKAFARRNPKLTKAGKWGAIAAAVIGVGALLLSKCSSDKAEEVKAEDVKQAPVNEAPKEEQPKEETPVAPVEEKPAYEPIVKLNDDGTYTTKKNDSFYKLAENLLKDYCAQNGIDKEIKSTSPEVQILAERIMKKNEYWYDPKYTEATKRLSAPMLYPDETLEMVDIADLVKKEEEVKKQLK
jgi:hypothetical protein